MSSKLSYFADIAHDVGILLCGLSALRCVLFPSHEGVIFCCAIINAMTKLLSGSVITVIRERVSFFTVFPEK